MDGAIFLGIIAQLLLPEEIIEGVALCLVEIIDDISVMDLNGDQCHDDLPYNGWDLSSDYGSEFF
jgi:hypothetical protein